MDVAADHRVDRHVGRRRWRSQIVSPCCLLRDCRGLDGAVLVGRRRSGRGSPPTRAGHARAASSCSRSRTSPPTAPTSAATPSICGRCSTKRGFTAELLETAGNPLVYARAEARRARTRTLLFYCHYDGQPVDPQGMATSRIRSRRSLRGRTRHLRAVGVRRQVADRHDCSPRSMRLKAAGDGAVVEHPRHPRRRGRGGLAEPRAGDRAGIATS